MQREVAKSALAIWRQVHTMDMVSDREEFKRTMKSLLQLLTQLPSVPPEELEHWKQLKKKSGYVTVLELRQLTEPLVTLLGSRVKSLLASMTKFVAEKVRGRLADSGEQLLAQIAEESTKSVCKQM